MFTDDYEQFIEARIEEVEKEIFNALDFKEIATVKEEFKNTLTNEQAEIFLKLFDFELTRKEAYQKRLYIRGFRDCLKMYTFFLK